jgi:hypothetical protein
VAAVARRDCTHNPFQSPDAGLKPIFLHDIAVHRVGIERAVELAADIVFDRTEERAGGISAVAGECEVFFDQALGGHVHRHKPYFVALALDAEVHHAVAALDILHPQSAELLTAEAVIQQNGEDGAVAHTFKSVSRWRLQQPARLHIAQGRCTAFIAVGHGAFDAVDRIAGDGVVAEVGRGERAPQRRCSRL